MGIYRPPDEDGQGGNEDRPQDKQGDLAESRRRSISTAVIEFVNENPAARFLNTSRKLCGKIVNHPKVQYLIIALIIVNAVMMGVATFDFVTENTEVDHAFEVTDAVFLWIFTIELAMQLIYRGYTLFLDSWLVFDFVIVVLSWALDGLQVVRAFRIFRALRIITRIETMRNLLSALGAIMPRLGAICGLLLLIFYIFAVLFTQLFGEFDQFARLDYSLLTLFVMMTMEWADVTRECMEEIWWAWAPFLVFIMVTGFIVFNLIIAVVCDAVAVIENKEDLEPDFFGGILGRNSEVEAVEEEEEEENTNKNGTYPDAKNNGMVTYEDELVDNLAERISSLLKSQKEMLMTLESLTKDD